MAKAGTVNPATLLGDATRSADLRHRLLFLLGALVVYRMGTYIPVPGIDLAQFQQFFQQQSGTILSMFNMFSGGALERLSIFALGIMPYISASIILQMGTHVIPALQQLRKEGESGRRKITQYTRYATVVLASFQSVAAASALADAGRGVESGTRVRADCSHHARHGHDVPDVARRADHRARHRQRHLDDHLGQHPGRLAVGDRRHARARQYGRHEPGDAVPARLPGARRDGLRRLHGARAAAHRRQLREAAARPAHVRGPDEPSAVQDQHVGRHPADLRVELDPVPGDDRELVSARATQYRGYSASPRACRRASRSTSCCTRR